jgi:flagellar protein FlaJ
MPATDSVRSVTDTLFDRKNYSRTLRGSRTTKTYDEYIRYLLQQTVMIAAGMVVIVVAMHLFLIRFTVLKPYPSWVQDALIVAVPTILLFVALYVQPVLTARGRKARIDTDLSYAVTYMQALSTTLTLYNVFRSVYEQQDLYGEVSKEFSMIVRDVELFGDDLVSAMRNLGHSTPSEVLKRLMDDLILMFESGGDITAFFASRSAHYREVARNELEMGLKTMEIMAEVYVAAFVAAPIAVIIMTAAETMTGQSQLSALMVYFFIGLPLGAAAMIWILSLVLPAERLEITRRTVTETEYATGVPLSSGDQGNASDKFSRQMKSTKSMIRLQEILRHPVRHYIADYRFGIGLGILLSAAVVLLFWNGTIASLIPKYPFEVFICLFCISALVPVMVAFEIRRRYINKVEEQIPDFLRELADLKDIGMTLQGAIHLISNSKLGLLSSELRVVSDEVRWGSPVASALVRMEERIGVLMIKRAISLIVRASEVTDYIRDILMIAIGDMEHYLKMKRDRFTTSFAYIMIIYLSFGIFLYTAYVLNVSFISSFEKLNTTVDISGNILDMFRIAIILGLFSGIMAGQLSAANIMAGFKHSVLFLIATVVMFVYVL